MKEQRKEELKIRGEMDARIGLLLSSTDDDRTQVKKNFNNTVRRI
jgi:hypothetical protein